MINLSKNFISNKNIIEKLFKNYCDSNLPNSIIFNGPKGVGKSTAAFYLINKIYQNIESNNVKNSTLIYNNTNPNFRYITKLFDEKSNKLKKDILIDQIREIERFLNQSSIDGLPKFILIDAADDLNSSTSNAILKSLEEPKKNTFFILIAHQISSLLPTIRSRCINFVFNNLDKDQFSKILHDHNLVDINIDINFLFCLTNGSPGLALDIYSENMMVIFKDIIQIFIDKDKLLLNISNLTNVISDYNSNEFKNFIFILKFILLSFIKINSGYRLYENYFSESIEYLKKVAIHIPNSISLNILDFVNENEKDLFIYNLNKKIFCFNLFSFLNK